MNETKYIKLDWPEYQDFMDLEDAIFCGETYSGSYFVPEDSYNKRLKQLKSGFKPF